MKRTTLVAMALLLVLGIALITGCGTDDLADSEVPIDEDVESNTQIPNPVLEHENVEEMIATTGVPMTIPAGVSVIGVRSIDERLNEVEVLSGATTYVLRKSGSTDEDISGVHEMWETTESMPSLHPDVDEVTVSRTGDAGVILWDDGQFAHSIFAPQGFDLDTALKLVVP